MRYYTVPIEILTGDVNFSERIQFPVVGKVLAASLIHTKPSKPVEIELLKSNGDTLIEASDTDDWVQSTGGDYLSRKKPMGFDTQNLTVKAMSESPQTADYSGKLMFIIDENP